MPLVAGLRPHPRRGAYSAPPANQLAALKGEQGVGKEKKREWEGGRKKWRTPMSEVR